MNLLPTVALISVHRDPAHETGSQNVYVRQLGEALSRLGWRVDMFTRKTEVNQPKIVQHSSNCRTIRLEAGTLEFVPRQQLIGYLPEFVSQLRQFQLAQGVRYSIIHSNYWLSAWVGMELKKTQSGLKHIHTFHSLGALKYAKVRRLSNIARTRLAIEKSCLINADLTIATCPQQKEYLRQLVSHRGQVEIIPCGTDVETFGSVSRSLAKEQLGIAPDVFNILYVGRFSHRQGIETLIEAVSKPSLHRQDNMSLTLVSNSALGDLAERERIEQLVWRSGIDNITNFVDLADRSKLAAYYAAADVCVVPSRYSSSGMVAIEAMASGTPVIAANVGGLKYAVEPGQTGLLFPAKSTSILTHSIARLMGQPEWRGKMSLAARERAEELFNWNDVAEQIGEFYTELVAAPRSPKIEQSPQRLVGMRA